MAGGCALTPSSGHHGSPDRNLSKKRPNSKKAKTFFSQLVEKLPPLLCLEKAVLALQFHYGQATRSSILYPVVRQAQAVQGFLRISGIFFRHFHGTQQNRGEPNFMS